MIGMFSGERFLTDKRFTKSSGMILNALQRGPGPHFLQDGEVIVQGFGFTGDFLDEWNNSVYCRVHKIACRFKEQARIRHSCEKCGLRAESMDARSKSSHPDQMQKLKSLLPQFEAFKIFFSIWMDLEPKMRFTKFPVDS